MTDGRRLAEVNCTRIEFEPGDRILVRVYHLLSVSEQVKLERMIKRWAREPDIEILIIDARKMEIEIEHRPKMQLPNVAFGPGR